MSEFEEHRGFTWEFVDAPGVGASLHLMIEYGLLDERPEHTGTLQVALEHLRRELGRPIELPVGVYVPQVEASVDPRHCQISVRGERAAVAAACRRLHSAFEQAVIDESTPPLAVPLDLNEEWRSDLTLRFGCSALSFAGLPAPTPGAAARATALLRELSPRARRHRCVLTTDDRTLVDELDLPPAPAAPRAVTPPAPHAERPENRFGAIDSGPEALLWSVLVPRSPDGFTALNVLKQDLGAALTAMHPDAPQVQLSILNLAREALVVYRVGAKLTIRERRQLAKALLTEPMPTPDPVLEEIARAVNDADFAHHHRLDRLHGLPQSTPATVAGARAALAQARRTAHLRMPFVSPSSGADPRDITADLPFLTAPAGILGHRRFTTSVPRNKQHRLGTTPRALGLDGARLGDITPSHDPTAPRDEVDLDALVMVYVEPVAPGAQPTTFLLIDSRMRSLTVVPALYQGRKRLEQLIAEKSAHVPRLPFDRLAPIAEHSAALVADVRRTSRIAYGATGALVVFALTLIVSQELSKYRPVEAAVGIGETVELGSGTTITLRSLVQEPFGQQGVLDIAAIEFCAGADRGADWARQHQQFDPSRFELWDATTQRPRVLRYTDDELDSQTVSPNTCVESTITFHASPGTPPQDGALRVIYESTAGDRAVWKQAE